MIRIKTAIDLVHNHGWAFACEKIYGLSTKGTYDVSRATDRWGRSERPYPAVSYEELVDLLYTPYWRNGLSWWRKICVDVMVLWATNISIIRREDPSERIAKVYIWMFDYLLKPNSIKIVVNSDGTYFNASEQSFWGKASVVTGSMFQIF